jgi:hypothetical protein
MTAKHPTLSHLLNVLLIVVSCLCGIVLSELVWGLALGTPLQPTSPNHYMLFSDDRRGTVFNNIEDFFIYKANTTINAKMFYHIHGQWIKEYDYSFSTNNMGLVQDSDAEPNMPSVLVLGNSFAEGLGAEPWFNSLVGQFSHSKFQFLNGGISGTGLLQMNLLHNYLLRQGFHIERVVLLFISADIDRNVWNHSIATLNCLQDYRRCVGDEDMGVYPYGLPADEHLQPFLEKLRALRADRWDKGLVRKRSSVVPAMIEKYLPITLGVVRGLRDKLSLRPSIISKNLPVITDLIHRYGNNILFIHAPQKEELLSGTIFEPGLVVRGAIAKEGGTLVDGHTQCGLTLKDYFSNDPHPNKLGYKKISNCVVRAIKEKWGDI